MTVSNMVVSLLGFGYQVTEPAVKTWTVEQRVSVERWIGYKNRNKGRPTMRPSILERYNRNGNHS